MEEEQKKGVIDLSQFLRSPQLARPQSSTIWDSRKRRIFDSFGAEPFRAARNSAAD